MPEGAIYLHVGRLKRIKVAPNDHGYLSPAFRCQLIKPQRELGIFKIWAFPPNDARIRKASDAVADLSENGLLRAGIYV